MKRATWVSALAIAAFAAHAALGATPKQLNVQVQSGQVRATASPLGAIVGTVAYGDAMTVLEEKGAWYKVSKPGSDVSGWMHSSALTTKKIQLRAGETDTQLTASSGEQALAGKGFSKDVEAAFKEKNAKIDFGPIDKAEKIKVSAEEMTAFLKAGHLQLAEGGAK